MNHHLIKIIMINKLDFIEIRNFCAQEIEKKKFQLPAEGEKYLQILSDEVYITMYKELLLICIIIH